MDKTIEVSIVIPIYNVEGYVSKTIESVQSQDFELYEIILVDDGSKDSSGEICDRYAANDKRITVIHQQNGGVMSARFAGVEAAKGKYIAFLDGDDRMPPTAIKSLFNAIRNTDYDYVNGNSDIIDTNGNILEPASNNNTYSVNSNIEYRKLIVRKTRGVNLKMYKRSILLEKPLVQIDPRIKKNEDIIFNILLSSKINKILIIKEVVAHIIERPGSASRVAYSEDYWMFVLEWLDENFVKFDIRIQDLVVYKLYIIYSELIRNSNKKIDFNNNVFDNVKRTCYDKEYGWYRNLTLFLVRHPWSWLLRICRSY